MSVLFQNQQQSSSSDLANSSSLPQLETILQPKCPLECYLRLVFSRSGHDLNYIFDHGLDLVQSILNTHKKQTQLQQTAYLLVFDWLENLIYKYSTINSSDPKENGDYSSPQTLFRAAKSAHLSKLQTLLLVIFIPNTHGSHSVKIIDMFCAQIFKRLDVLLRFPPSAGATQRRQLEENFQNYLYLWLEMLITSIKSWHKYKNVVRIIDFLMAYSFQHQTKASESATEVINTKLLDEIMAYVKIDFGIERPSSLDASNQTWVNNL